MNERTESRVEGWDSRDFSEGYAALRELAEGEFSGVARTGTTWLCMLNGRVVGVFGGSIEDFADAAGTAYQAPHPSLPLLFAMFEKGGEVQAKYYTNDTPISEADEMLSDAGFTGYIELSENVLSGDYYVVYYGGRSMSAAFVGNSERLVAGDEAFQLADDEVGIYEVTQVDIEVTDIPDPERESGGAASGEAAAAASAPQEPTGTDTAPAESQDTAGQPGASEETEEGQRETDVGGPAEADTTAGESANADVAASPESADADQAAPRESASADAAAGADVEPTGEASSAGTETEEPAGAEAGPTTAGAGAGADESAGGTAGTPAAGTVDGTGVPKSEATFEEVNVVPSLSPDRTEVAEPGEEAGVEEPDAEAEGAAGADRETTGAGSAAGRESAGAGDTAGREPTGAEGADAGQPAGGTGPEEVTDRSAEATPVADTETATPTEPVPEDAEPAELRAQLETRQKRIQELETALTDLRVQRDGLTEERDHLQSEVDRLESEVTDLQSEVDELRSRLGDAAGDRRQISAEEALAGTNLFVRYGSKGGGTLRKAHDGDVEKEEVNNNLRLEHHTQFDTDAVAVDDRPFEEFLEASIYRQFVEWVVRELLYEIRDTGHVRGLKELYDAIPEIDRAELLGEVGVEFTEDGEQYREQRAFDVVIRDRMGNPLIVVDINDSRNPATREMMATVLENAGEVKDSHESLASAMLVTASFFEPEALEAADEASSGGLFSRDARRSFVKVSRKQGYHLLLVETRGGEFHINVPEL